MLTSSSLLSARDHERFLDEGFVVVRGLLDLDGIATALEVLESDADADSKQAAADQCLTERFFDAARELLGPAVPLSDFMGGDAERAYEPEKVWLVGPHVDMWHPAPMPDECFSLSAFVFLTAVRRHGGAFMYAPKSAVKLRALSASSSGEVAWSLARSETHVGVMEEYLAEPGDVMFFQHLIVHSASPNVTDRATRHAMRIFISSSSRVVPGDKPFEEMSTVEKANSMRYLNHRFGDEFVVLEPAQGATDPFPCVAHDLIRLDGSVYRFWTEASAPTVLRRARSSDLATWQELEPLELVSEPIRAIHFEHRFNPTLTVVCDTATADTWSRVFESVDLQAWRQIAGQPTLTLGRPHYVSPGAKGPFAKQAGGSINYIVSDERPTEIHCGSGGNREDLAGLGGEVTKVVSAPGRVSDLFGRPLIWLRPNTTHALVADVDGASHYTLSEFIDEFAEPLAPFVSDGPVSRMRVFERASRYWLVTFARDGHVHWGAIDWAAEPGRVWRLTTSTDLRAALQIVGLI